jgi:hypothetical protein
MEEPLMLIPLIISLVCFAILIRDNIFKKD